MLRKDYRFQEKIILNIFWRGAVMRVSQAGNTGGKMMSERKNSSGLVDAPTRRQLIAGVAAAFGGLSMGSAMGWAGAEEEISHTAESIHQEPVFKASRKRVYEALTDAKQFDKVIHLGGAMRMGEVKGTAATEISREVGGAFTLFAGHIVGRHLELLPN